MDGGIEELIDGCAGTCMCIFPNIKDYRQQDTSNGTKTLTEEGTGKRMLFRRSFGA